jgi:hypothetical protein
MKYLVKVQLPVIATGYVKIEAPDAEEALATAHRMALKNDRAIEWDTNDLVNALDDVPDEAEISTEIID